ncbi:hypothetical protein Q0F98_01730 [Paenibacillus amylolyticus]|nr:hypothetical protein Q0F98_01730 [Paenibacillus amylolyticus]
MEELKRMNDAKQYLQSYAYWHIYEHGNDDERSVLRQSEPDARAWNAMVLRHRVGEVLLDKLLAVYTPHSTVVARRGRADGLA